MRDAVHPSFSPVGAVASITRERREGVTHPVGIAGQGFPFSALSLRQTVLRGEETHVLSCPVLGFTCAVRLWKE